MNHARDEIWPRARDKHIAIEDVPSCDDALVHGDPALLSRALVNLLGNAVDYSAAHTRIACSVELADDGASVRCVIRDDGYGIAAEDQARLFERYRRFRLPGQPDTKGVGPAWRSRRRSWTGTAARSTCAAPRGGARP